MSNGKRSISFINIALPKRINGIVMTSPTNSMPKCPFAAPAMPSTLSRLMTMSAMMIVFTASQKLSLSLTLPSSSSGSSSLTPIHSNSTLPMIWM